MRRFLVLLLALGLTAAACADSSDEGSEGSETTTASEADEASNSEEEQSGDDAADNGSDSDTAPSEVASPDPDFDYTTVDYDAEPGANALFGDRSNPIFPPPLVPIADIVGGGPPPDGIPSIDFPEFVSVAETTFMESDGEPIVAVTVDGVTKGYPIRIMTWHEIVNDVFATPSGDVPVTVTYCPLCNSALAYDRRVGDRVLDFGTSGELYQSAMVMYDRQTQSLWSHFLGQGIVGHYAGLQLEFVPAQTLSWGAFKDSFPDAMVVDQAKTGHERSYGNNPYAGYDEETSGPFPGFVTQEIDDRLLDKERVIGIRDGQNAVALELDVLASVGVVAVTDNDWNYVAFFQDGLVSALDASSIKDGRQVGQTGVFVAEAGDGTALTFTATDDGFVDDQTGSTWSITGAATDGPLAGEQLTALSHVDTFWFAWSIFQPNTTIWGQ